MSVLQNLGLRRPSPRRAIPAGIAGSTAYLVAMSLDRALTGNRYDDLLLWGGPVARDSARRQRVGVLIHYSAGIALAAAYEMLSPLLPSWPPLLRGVLFVQVENALLFPGVALIDRVHPAVKSGELPPLWSRRYLLVEVWRHVAFGAGLGWVER